MKHDERPRVLAIPDVQATIRSLRQGRQIPFGAAKPAEPGKPKGRRRPAKERQPLQTATESSRPQVDPATVRLPARREVRAILAGGGTWRFRMSYDDIETPDELKVLLNAGILDEYAIEEDMYWVDAAVLVDRQQRPLFRLKPLEGWTPLARLLGFGNA